MDGETKYRLLLWGDMKSGAKWFGIQAKPPGSRRYLHCFEGDRPLIYPSREEAKAKIAKLAKAAP